MTANEVIEKLKLAPLAVEGGHFCETYRSEKKLENGDCLGTSICYLLKSSEISRWHKVSKDEIWHYHAGSPAIQMLLYPDGSWKEIIIGADIAGGHLPQSLIPAGVWQAAVLMDNSINSWGLFGATVFPGFEYKDYTEGKGSDLAKKFPSAEKRMKELGLFL